MDLFDTREAKHLLGRKQTTMTCGVVNGVALSAVGVL